MIDINKLNNVENCNLVLNDNPVRELKEIERSIIKKFRKPIWTKFIRGIQEYEMIENGDKIAVCLSGGKDSYLLAKLLQELQKHSQYEFELEFIAMNPGFHDINYQMLEKGCKELGINVRIFDTEIFKVVEKIAKDYPCYMCARMRRGALYDYAQQLGCNKIALGHHFDDFIETTMMNVLYAGKFNTMMPKLKATNYQGMELIRPMVYIRETDIRHFINYTGVQAMNCGCVVAAGKTSSKRAEVKELLKQLREINPEIDKSIFSSAKNVNIASIIGWEFEGTKHKFTDNYNKETNE